MYRYTLSFEYRSVLAAADGSCHPSSPIWIASLSRTHRFLISFLSINLLCLIEILPNDSSHIDQPLLCLISEGDEQAFRVLFDHYKDRFYFVALKMTRLDYIAEEMVQEVFLKIWRNRETLHGIDNPDAYFFTMLYRRVYQYYKKEALDKKLLQEAKNTSSSENATEASVLARESKMLLEAAILKLPPQQQLIYRLNKMEGFSYNEIADKLHLSPNTVRNHLATAVRSIRIHLRHLGELGFVIGIFSFWH